MVYGLSKDNVSKRGKEVSRVVVGRVLEVCNKLKEDRYAVVVGGGERGGDDEEEHQDKVQRGR